MLPLSYEDSFPYVCRCLCHIAHHKVESGSIDAQLVFSEHSGLPSSTSLISRLMSFIAEPLRSWSAAENSLRFLRCISASISTNMYESCKDTVVEMIRDLQSHRNASNSQISGNEDVEFAAQWQPRVVYLFKGTSDHCFASRLCC